MATKRVVVLGATGHQGGAVVDALKAVGGFTIVATSRNPNSASSKKLAEKGCEVAKLSSLESASELTEVFKGADGVFAVTTILNPKGKVDVAMEKRQGESIVKAARAASVPFLVFTSVGSAADKTGVPHFESKMYIEELIETAGIPCFTIRPVAFMDNLGSEFQPLIRGQFTSILDPKVKLQLVAVADIGKVAAIAFQDPAKFTGMKLEFAGDYLTNEEQAAALGKVRGEGHYKVKTVPALALRLFAYDFYLMRRFFETRGYHADIEQCRSLVPSLMTFENFLKFKGYDKCSMKEPSGCCIQ